MPEASKTVRKNCHVASNKPIEDVIDFPCIITDCDERILCVYLPSVLSEAMQETIFNSRQYMQGLHAKHVEPPPKGTETQMKRSEEGMSFNASGSPSYFPPRTVQLAPLKRALCNNSSVPSAGVEGKEWKALLNSTGFAHWRNALRRVAAAETLLVMLSCPAQLELSIGRRLDWAKEAMLPEIYKKWPFAMDLLTVFSNCFQPLDRNWDVVRSGYTVLMACGTYTEGAVTMADLGTRFCMPPGSMMLFCGGILRHEMSVSGGESLLLKGEVYSSLQLQTTADSPQLQPMRVLWEPDDETVMVEVDRIDWS
ncbi:hypothetical protein BDW22DRAFT_1477421 [Trametopsis cervina]|nr:hypothetical protein BDW22DRAFT_1477421 [Trametopsis cervina]